MPATGLDIFDKAVQKSNEWLNELGQQMVSARTTTARITH